MEKIFNNLENIKEILEILEKNQRVVLDSIELDDTHNSILYDKMVKIPIKDINYTDIAWIFDSYGKLEEVKREIFVNCDKIEMPIYDYISSIIANELYLKRDKIVLILAHMEACIFQCLDFERVELSIIKNISKITKDNNKVTAANYGRIYIMGMAKILYANTSKFEKEVDKRLPFRNHILHQGIVNYSDDNIETLYYILLCFFARLTECKKAINLEKKEIEKKHKSTNIQ